MAPYEQPSVTTPENVSMGILFAIGGVLVGMVAAAAVYHFGFIASIVALGMAIGCLWLYGKGAGSPPRKGAVPLLVLIILGLVLAWLFTLGTELYLAATEQGATAAEALSFASSMLFDGRLWSATGTDALIFFLFGALGLFGSVRQLLAARKG